MNNARNTKFATLHRQEATDQWFKLKDQIKDYISRYLDDEAKAYKALAKFEETVDRDLDSLIQNKE